MNLSRTKTGYKNAWKKREENYLLDILQRVLK